MEFEDILNEWSYRCQSGFPSFSNIEDLELLKEILLEKRLDPEFIQEYVSDVELFGLLLEAPNSKDILNKTIKNPKTGKLIKVSTALEYEKTHPAYKAAKALFKKGDKAEPKKQPVKVTKAASKEKSSPQNDKLLKLPDAGPKKVINGKDKTLKKVDSLKTPAFNEVTKPPKIEFDKNNKKYQNTTPPPPFKFPVSLTKGIKTPKKYLDILERMINTRPEGAAVRWSHFSTLPGGAGTINSQAGEIFSMLGTSMNDKDFEELVNSVSSYQEKLMKSNPKLYTRSDKSAQNMILDPKWIKAAKGNRKAILNRIQKMYGKGSTISAVAWDTEDDVTALGLPNYKKNKGFSTDFYIKVKDKNGKEILDEVSLKQSLVANLLNSGVGMFTKWNPKLKGSALDVNVFGKKMKESLETTTKKNLNKINDFMKKSPAKSKELRELLSHKGIKSVSDAITGKGSARDKNKVMFYAMKMLADNGDANAKKFVKNHLTLDEEFTKTAMTAISKDPSLKSGMLDEVRTEFPLKSILSTEESMALGEYSLDKYTCEKIFGTSDYNSIKDGLTAVTDKSGNSYLAYKAKAGNKVIPIANIKIRQPGRGYAPDIKFEMQLHTDFKNQIRAAHKAVYGG